MVTLTEEEFGLGLTTPPCKKKSNEKSKIMNGAVKNRARFQSKTHTPYTHIYSICEQVKNCKIAILG